MFFKAVRMHENKLKSLVVAPTSPFSLEYKKDEWVNEHCFVYQCPDHTWIDEEAYSNAFAFGAKAFQIWECEVKEPILDLVDLFILSVGIINNPISYNSVKSCLNTFFNNIIEVHGSDYSQKNEWSDDWARITSGVKITKLVKTYNF
jgi:hypothetical protein